MGKIPGVNHLDAVRALEKAGFRIVRQRKHIVMSDGVRILTIPRHNPVNAYTMGGIVKDAGLTPEQFHEIFRGVCIQSNLQYNTAVVDDLIRMIAQEYNEPLRACYPRDIVGHVTSGARYLQKEPRLEGEAVAQACRNYFLSPSQKVSDRGLPAGLES